MIKSFGKNKGKEGEDHTFWKSVEVKNYSLSRDIILNIL